MMSQAIRTALSPAQCAMRRVAGEASLKRRDVDELRARHLILVDGALPDAVVDACREEAEALDAKGYLQVGHGV